MYYCRYLKPRNWLNHYLYPGGQTVTINYSGQIPGYVYGGVNTLSEIFDNYPGWSFTFMGGTLTLHYGYPPQPVTVNSDANSCFATVVLPTPVRIAPVGRGSIKLFTVTGSLLETVGVAGSETVLVPAG